MDDSQLLRVTASPTDVETLRASHARLLELAAENRRLIKRLRAERDEAREAAKHLWVAGDPWCEHLHHERNQYHEKLQCPAERAILKRWPWLKEETCE